MPEILSFSAPADVIRHWRTVVCAVDGRPASLRNFAELCGNVNYERVRQFEAGLDPDQDVCAEWFTHQDERIVELARTIFLVRSRNYLRDHGRDAYSLPTFMTTSI